MKKFAIVLAAMFLLFSLIALLRSQSQSARKDQVGAGGGGFDGAEALEKLKESWIKDRKLLASYEIEQSRMRAEVIVRRRLYQDGEISKAEVLEAEQAFVKVGSRIFEVRRSMIESDMAMTEATAQEEAPGLPVPGFNGAGGSKTPTRFNGSAPWSLQHAKQVEGFFREKFGRGLPISAYGQTAAHSRMRFDHRHAMDVAIHPDSVEGKVLIDYLRRSGIPYATFRDAVAGASTGAHIHIGNPSRRAAVN